MIDELLNIISNFNLNNISNTYIYIFLLIIVIILIVISIYFYMNKDKKKEEKETDIKETFKNEDKNWLNIIKNNNKLGSIVLFYADWCGACHHYMPIYNNIMKDVKNIKKYDFYKIEEKEHTKIGLPKDIIRHIDGYPTLLFISSRTSKINFIKDNNALLKEIEKYI